MHISRLLSQLRSYWSSYYVLLRHFVRWNPWDALTSAFGVLVVAILYPLPFFVLARATAAVLGDEDKLTLPYNLVLSIPEALGIAIGSFLIISLVQFLVQRHIIRRNIAWQQTLYREIALSLPRMARIDLISNLKLPLRLETLHRSMTQATRGAMLIGRLIANGVRDLIIVIWTAIVLAYLDIGSLLAILLVSIAFVPVYAAVATRMVTATRQRQQDHKALSQRSLEIIRGLSRLGPRRVQASREIEAFDATGLYGLANIQYQILKALNLVTAFHTSIIAVAVFAWMKFDGRSFGGREAAYLAVLLVFLKSVIGLSALLSRLMRAYPYMSMLRDFISPQSKKPRVTTEHENSGGVLVRSLQGQEMIVSPGDIAYVLMPPVQYAFELLGLSNSMYPFAQPPGAVATRLPPSWIGYLDDNSVAVVLKSATGTANRGVSAGDNVEEWEVRTKAEIDAATVLAISFEAWSRLDDNTAAALLGCNKPVIVCIPPHADPDLPEGAPLIVCDGRRVLAVGEAKTLLAQYRERIAAAGTKQAPQEVDLEDDDL